MKNLWHFLAFVLAFSIEVQVKAEISEENYRMDPPGCWSQIDLDCSLRTKGDGSGEIEMLSAQINFPGYAVLTRKSENHLRLVKGFAVVVATGMFTLETRYGNVKLKKNEVVFVEIKSDRVEVTSISGMPKMQMLGGKEDLLLPAPYQNWMGGMLTSGRARGGRARPGNFKRWLESWGRVSSNQELIRQKAKAFRPIWKEALFTTGARDLAAAEDHQKQLDQKRKEAAYRRRLVREENARLKKIFIEKTFEVNADSL